MKLLIILMCLLSERFLPHAVSYQRFCWFHAYYQRIKKLAEKNGFFTNSWGLLALIVLPILLSTLFIYGLLGQIFLGFMGFLLNLAIFFYCLGPENVFYPPIQVDSADKDRFVANYFVAVNRQLFSLIFWYMIAGPITALTYRLISLCCDINTVSPQANEITDLLEWIPARLTALFFLLVGNFQRGFTCFTRLIFTKPDNNKELLGQCGIRAVRENDSDEVPMLLAESLVDHAIVVMLVLIALFTLISRL